VKYIVLYVWIQTIIVACPSPELQPDEYGRLLIPSYSSELLCLKEIRHHMQKPFATLIDAQRFVAGARDQRDLVEFRLRKIKDPIDESNEKSGTIKKGEKGPAMDEPKKLKKDEGSKQ